MAIWEDTRLSLGGTIGGRDLEITIGDRGATATPTTPADVQGTIDGVSGGLSSVSWWDRPVRLFGQWWDKRSVAAAGAGVAVAGAGLALLGGRRTAKGK